MAPQHRLPAGCGSIPTCGWYGRFRVGSGRRPIWISQRPRCQLAGSLREEHSRCGGCGRPLDRRTRRRSSRETAPPGRRSAGCLAEHGQPAWLSSRSHAEWRSFAPFGTIGVILDTAGANLAVSEECLNLVARHQIPYRVIDRSQLGAQSLAGLRAVLAFDLAPPTDAERKTLSRFAAEGGLVLGGPSWGTPPKDQSYTVEGVGKGEVAVYKETTPIRSPWAET